MNAGRFQGVGIPAQYGTKLPKPSQKTSLHLPRAVPQLKFSFLHTAQR